MKSLIITLFLAAAVHRSHSLCNTCSAVTNTACVDQNKFKMCTDGIPQPPALVCATGTMCSPGPTICVPIGSVEPSCNMCNQCNEDKTFACTGYNTFALCLGEDQPDATTNYQCADGLVCNIDSPSICTDRNITGIGSTCPWSPPVTTTAEPPTTLAPTVDPATSPQAFCASTNERGRYEIPSDSTCSRYINCYQSNGNWFGNIYMCPSKTYFNTTSRVCGTGVPDRCKTGASSADEICD